MSIDGIVQWIHLHPHWGGVITMLISAAESVAVLGTVVPGSLMMTIIGTLIGMGVLPFTGTILWAIAGAVLGDGLSYWLGYRLKDRIRRIWPFRRYPKILQTGEEYFKRHGGKSVFFGRFIGAVRAIVPLIAGMIGLKPVKFIAANIVSAIIWAPLYMVPGYFIGAASLQLPPTVAIRLIVTIIISIFALIFLAWMIREIIIKISDHIHNVLDKIWLHLKSHKHEHFLTVWFKSSETRHLHGQLGSAFAILVFGLLFIFIATCVYTHSIFMSLNHHIYYLFRGLRLYGVDQFFVGVTFLGQSTVIIPTMIVLSLVLFITKHRRTAAYCLGLTIITPAIAYALKYFLHNPRPGGIVHAPITYSFPSGHVTLSIAFYSFILMLLLSKVKLVANRKTLIYSYVTIIALIAVSRLYLGAHWLTDVIGAMCLGATCFFICRALYYRHPTKSINTQLVLFTVLISLAVFWTAYFSKHFKQQSYDYQRTWPIITVKRETWWSNQAQQNLIFRRDRFGFPAETLNIQWAAKMSAISQQLQQHQWQTIEKFYWSDFLHPTELAKRISVVPIIPKLFRNSSPRGVFVKRLASGQVIVLRLWDSHIRLAPHNTPLWVGLLQYQQVYVNKKLLPLPKQSPDNAFTQYLTASRWRIVKPNIPAQLRHFKINDKHLLLIKDRP